MRPLTDDTHKTLLKVGNRTLIQRIIDPLLANEVIDITLVTGYKADEIKRHLSEVYPEIFFSFIHNARYAETNNIYSMSLALDFCEINSDVLLIECDLIFEPEIIHQLINSPLPNVAAVDRYRPGMDGTVVAVKNNIVTDVIPPHLQDAEFDFKDKYKTLNIYKFSKEFCAGPFRKLITCYANLIDQNAYYELILGVLIYLQKETVYALIVNKQKWTEIDDPNDLDFAVFAFDPLSRLSILNRSFGGFWNYDVLDFCFIRNMYFPTGSVISELRNNLVSVLLNYGSSQRILDRKLSHFLLCDHQCVALLNGAAEIFPLLRNLFGEKRVLLPSPSFGEYARIFPRAQRYSDDLGINTALLEEKARDCEIIVIVNPNNPTGTTLPCSWIFEFSAANPGKTFIVDESFLDFSDESGLMGMLERRPLSNVLLVKSLSKSLGVPGLRLGFLYSSNRQFVANVRGELPIWNSNSMAEFFLEIVLKHRDSIQASFSQTKADRAAFAAELEPLPFVSKVYLGGGNFLLVTLKLDSVSCQQLVERLLLEHGIYVKNVSERFETGRSCLRLAVRLPQENQRLVACLSSLMLEWEHRVVT